jgi:hypothetical protein
VSASLKRAANTEGLTDEIAAAVAEVTSADALFPSRKPRKTIAGIGSLGM